MTAEKVEIDLVMVDLPKPTDWHPFLMSFFFSFLLFQFLGKWYEVERSFYLPELASGCTTMTFENTTLRDEAGRSQLEISIKSVNQW